MLKMFQRNRPSYKEIDRQLSAALVDLAQLRQKHLDLQIHSDNQDRELIAAKADRRNMEAEVARLKAEASTTQGVRRLRPTTPLESAQKRAEMEGVDKVTRGRLIQHAAITVESHPDYIAAKAIYDKAIKDKKKNKDAFAVLKAVRERLYAAGCR